MVILRWDLGLWSHLTDRRSPESSLRPLVIIFRDLWLLPNMTLHQQVHPYGRQTRIHYVSSLMSRLMGKPTICIVENKDADQLRGNREADQRLCFHYSDSTIPLLLKSEISSFLLFPVLVQAGLCRDCSETTLLVFPRDGSFVYVYSDRSCYNYQPKHHEGARSEAAFTCGRFL